MKKVERNDPCPCGSGKKYKLCCLKKENVSLALQQTHTAPLPHLIDRALALHQAGNLTDAATLYQQILLTNPRHSDALHLLGVIAHQQGNNELAVELINKSITINSVNPLCYVNLGNALKELAKFNQAEKSYQAAIKLNPNFAEAHFNLGNVFKEQNKFDEAIACYQRAIALKSDYAEPHINFAVVLQEQEKLDLAVTHYLRALDLQPESATVHCNLGIVLHKQGELTEAIEYCRKAILLNPNFAGAYSALGVAVQEQGKIEEAIACYQQSLMLDATDAETINSLGTAFLQQNKLSEAADCYRQACALNPNYFDAYCNLGNALKNQGKLNEAITCYQQALNIKADYANGYDNLLFALLFDSATTQTKILEIALTYEKNIGHPLRSTWQPHSNDKNPARRLRIGYVSPDFRNHAVAYFAEPILSNHDKTQVEVYCYAEVMLEDDVTHRFQTYADHWHSTVGLSDETMAQLIREHQIDILIDLAGHTAKNRLPVFARKPAPIQMTYLGYPGTSGLSAMDYRITDVYADPVGIADAYYSEKLLRLPHSLCCYHPSADMPEVTPLPALERGYMTFGSFNNFNKIDQATLELWSAMLRSIPTARLMMLTVPEGEVRQQLSNRFAALGIEAHRLTFHGKLPGVEFHRKFLEVDISLDSMTVSGGTTTCESLWMGVPVIAFVGDRFITRVSYSFLNTVGFSDFAVETPEAFLHLTQHLANNLPLLAGIRQELREHLRSSPLVDEQTFTRNLQALYRDAWNKWCNA